MQEREETTDAVMGELRNAMQESDPVLAMDDQSRQGDKNVVFAGCI
ncbi:MAG: hypothetical protein ACFFD4_39760 [Candidatus Odinarchaeota archaeon]